MDVSALKQQQSPFAPAADQAAQPSSATDEFLAVFRKHLTGGGGAAANSLSDPNKVLFLQQREKADPTVTVADRQEATADAPAAPERPRDRQKADQTSTDDAADAPAEEAEAPQQPTAKPTRNAQKGRKAEENAEAQEAPVVDETVLPEEVPAIVMLVAPAQVNDQGPQESVLTTPSTETQAIAAPEEVGEQGVVAAKPVEKDAAQAPIFELKETSAAAEPAQVAAATAAQPKQRRKIEIDLGGDKQLEEPVQVTLEAPADTQAAQRVAARTDAANMLATMTAAQEELSDELSFAPQFTASTTSSTAAPTAAPSAASTATDATLAADALADASIATPVMPTMAAAAEAGPANAAAKPMIEGTSQVGAAGGAQAASGTDKAKAPAAPPPARAVPPKELVPEIKAQVIKAVADGVDRINIKMRPEQLGRIEIKLEVGQDGRLTASFTAENKDTLQMLQRDARELHKAFQEAGLQTDSSSLTFNLKGGQGGERQAGEGQKRGGQKMEGGIEAAIEEKIAAETPMRRSSGVDIRV